MKRFISLLRELKSRGIEEAWLVGGVVRDFFLGREPTDVDIACGESDVNAVVARLGGAIVGKPPFCTVSTSLLGFPVEISLLSGPGIPKDLERRDFTINALAMDAEGNIIDPFGGAGDIRRRVLRLVPAPASPYDADPVRVVRLLRFACTLGFAVDPETEERTKSFIAAHKGELANVAQERYGKELLKGFAERPHYFLSLLEDYFLLPVVLPQVEAMRGVEQPVIFHPEGDVLRHTFRVLAEAEKTMENTGQDVVLALGALLHDVGKPQSAQPHPKYERVCFFGHQEAGEEIALDLLSGWAVPGKTASQVAALVKHHMIPGGNFTKRTCVKLIRKLGPELAEKLFDLALCDARGSMGSGENIQAARELFLEVLDNLRQAQEASDKRWVNGHDVMEILGIPPGPEVGRVLEELDVAAGTGRLRGKDEALGWLKERAKGEGKSEVNRTG
ncbi:MAG: HDIG domain-containing protein [Synergistaceae bacterium]|jgi:putative nucleotidyltransferase with HDIG domain|nr:HDIG domain-containing protein [Synergistaceae bacterium]